MNLHITLNPVQTLALALGLGSLVSLVAMRLRIPPILPLLLVGVAVGRSGLGLVNANVLQSGLIGIISVSVALLVFEGSLHLDRRALAQSPKAVRGLLTIGAAVTWVLATLAAYYILGLSWGPALVLGAMLIVTGPTVIQPILRRVPLSPNLHAALTAEGVLIDPIGVLAAVPTLELVRATLAGTYSLHPGVIADVYVLPLVMGLVAGLAAGLLASFAMRRASAYDENADYRLNLLAMGAVMSAVGISESIRRESGLVAAAICGAVIANARIVGARQIRQFKEQISGFLVGALFILLAARFDITRFADIGWRHVLFLAAVLLAIRPLSVLAATSGSVLTGRERAFASFLAPRGIVAASLASIVALEFSALADRLRLAAPAMPEPQRNALLEYAGRVVIEGQMIETIMFLVIAVTVTIGGIFAGPVASLLGVRAGRPNGLAIIGAHRLGRELATALTRLGLTVRLVDSNPANVAAARAEGVPATVGDATDLRWLDEVVGTPKIGWILAATGNPDVDTVVWRWGAARFGAGQTFRWAPRPTDEPGDEQTTPAISEGRTLLQTLHQLDEGALQVATWTGPDPRGVPFALVENGNLRLLPAGAPRDRIPTEAKVIGLVERTPEATAAPESEAAPG